MWQFIIPAIASTLGAIGGGRAAGRQQAADTNLQRDALATSQYGTQQRAVLDAMLAAEAGNLGRANLDLNRRQHALDAPDQRGATAVRGDVMSRAQDVKISHPRANIPQISGGFTPSMLSDETRQTGRAMTRDALMNQLKGDSFEAVPTQDWQGGVMRPPSQTPLPQANWFDKFLSVASPIASLAGGVASGIGESQNSKLIQELLKQAQQGNASNQQPMLTPPSFNPTIRWNG